MISLAGVCRAGERAAELPKRTGLIFCPLSRRLSPDYGGVPVVSGR
jgi:hypothetical protein